MVVLNIVIEVKGSQVYTDSSGWRM